MAYASQRFLPNTTVKGFDVSGMSAEDVNEHLKSEGLLIRVDQRSKRGKKEITETLDLAEVAAGEIEYDTKALIDSQDKFVWFKSFFQPTSFDTVSARGTFDEKSLRFEVCGLSSQRKSTTIEPKDAYVKVVGGRITIMPEKEGNVVDRDLATEKILEAAEALMRGEGTQRVDLSGLCTEPSVRATDEKLIAEKEKLEEVLERTITINTTSYSEEVLKGADIFRFFDYGKDGLAINEEKLAEYVDGIANDYYVNRYEYILRDDLLEKLKAALLSDKPEDKDAAITASWYINYPQPRSNGNGSPSFIEISIGNQYLWYYESGNIIFSTPIVTGMAKASPTPTGYFTVTERCENARLIGKDYDLTVSYWMGLDYIGKYGIHDATWRWDFGGDIYMTDGSHGCVNLPFWAAEELFSRVQAGVTEVYIYD